MLAAPTKLGFAKVFLQLAVPLKLKFIKLLHSAVCAHRLAAVMGKDIAIVLIV